MPKHAASMVSWLPREFFQDRRQTGVLFARKTRLRFGVEFFAAQRKHREIGLGAADIAGED